MLFITAQKVFIYAGILCNILILHKLNYTGFQLFRVIISRSVFIIKQAPFKPLHFFAIFGKYNLYPVENRLEIQPQVNVYFISNGPLMGGGKYCIVFPKALLEKVGMPNFAQELENLMMEVFDAYTVENVEKLYDKMEEYLAALKEAGSINMGVNGNVVDANYGPFGQTYINQWGWERMFQVNWGRRRLHRAEHLCARQRGL